MQLKWRFVAFKIFSGLLLAAFFSGCTLELDVGLEPEEKVLTAYSFVNCEAGGATVIVEPSVAFNEVINLNDSKLNGPALVQLFREGALWAEYRQQGNSVYYSAAHPPVGQQQARWEMVVSHPDFGEGRATARPPAPGAFMFAALKTEYPLPGGGQAKKALEVKIQDAPGVRNYYEILLLNGPPDSLELVFLSTHFLFATGDTSFVPTNSFTLNGRWFFSDEVGDGEALTLAFGISLPGGELTRPWLNIRYVSEAYHEYMKSFVASEGQILEPLQAGYRGYSNFENIYGVFALYLEERVEVD